MAVQPTEQAGVELTPHTRFTSPGFLLNKVGVLASESITEGLAGVGITPRQGGVLLALRAGGPMSQGALGRELGHDPSTLVALLNDLELARLISRKRDPEDRRRHIVAITARGRRVREQADEAVTVIEETLLQDLDEDERDVLRELLLRIDASSAPSWE